MTENNEIIPNQTVLAGLTKPWRNFFDKFKEIDVIKVSKWKDVHVLAYICKRYYSHYGKKYSVAIKGAPGKSPDIQIIRRIIAMLDTSNMKVIKEYVDWVFDTKIITRKIKVNSLAFFLTSGFANGFQFYYQEKNKITRSSVLPDEFKFLAEALKININTYGDLAFIKLALEQDPENRQEYKNLFNHLKSLGFEEVQLEEIK